jgi:hypothetical protein
MAMPADNIITGRGQPQNQLLQIANVPAGVYGSCPFVQMTGAAADFSRTFCVSNDAPDWPVSMTCSNITFTGHETNAFYFLSGTNITAEILKVALLGGPSGPIRNLIIVGMVKYAITNATGSDINLDSVAIYGAANNFGVAQMRPLASGSGFALTSHGGQIVGGDCNTSTSGTGGTINLQTEKWYWRIEYRDVLDGYNAVGIVDPVTLDVVGDISSSITADSVCSSSTSFFQLLVGYIGNPPGYYVNGPQAVIYDATPTQYSQLLNCKPGPSIASPLKHFKQLL